MLSARCMTHLVPKGYAYGRFAPNQGDIAGYVHRIWRKYRAKWVVQMAGMNFKTRSKLSMEIPDVLQYDRIMLGCPIWCEKILSKGQVASSAKRQKNSISSIRACPVSIDYFYRRNDRLIL